jgi:DNA mismatch repair protein MutS
MGIYDDYAALVAQHKPTYGEMMLVMIEVGSFLEWYNCDQNKGADVRRVCDLLNVQATRKDKSVPQVSRKNPMLGGIPRHALPKYLPLLLEADYTVVLATQVTTDPITRRVTEIISRTTVAPGAATTRGGLLLPDAANNLMAVYVECIGRGKHASRMVVAGWATVDLTTGRTAAGECGASTAEDPRLPWDELHRAATVAEPREVVVVGDAGAKSELCTHLGFPESRVRSASPELTLVGKASYQDAVLRKVFPNTGFLTPAEYLDLERKPHALAALVAALQFAYEHNETIVARVMRPSREDAADGGMMSYNSLQQLDVLSSPSSSTSPAFSTSASSASSSAPSLLSVLNCCKTAPGRRAFRRRLLDPVTCPAALRARYDAIDAALKDDRHAIVRARLADVCDLERAFRRTALGLLSPSDVPSLLASLAASAAAMEALGRPPEAYLRILAVAQAALDQEACARFTLDDIRGSVFLAGVHPDIDGMQRDLAHTRSAYHDAAKRINAAAGAEHVRVDESDAEGVLLTITAKRWRALQDRFPDFSLCPASLRLSHADLGAERNRRVVELRRSLTATVRERYVFFLKEALFHPDDMADAVGALEDADVTCACAHNAMLMRHVRPSLSAAAPDGGSFLRAAGLRHALAERLNTSVVYVPNDVAIGSPTVGVLLYGVNAAGKSSTMKAVGVCVLMAQAGMFVACDACELSPFRRVMTRIGLRDDLLRGHSTFVVEMLELRNILRRAGPNTLVIGDELCAGTEAASALSIVGAGVQRLTGRGVRFMFATHLHELVELPGVRALLDEERVAALHVSVRCEPSNGKLVFDRKLLPGRGMPTYGLEVCRSLDMDAEFLKAANDIRRHVLGVPAHIVRPRASRYNAAVFVDVCGMCGKPADHTHHVRFQSEADARGYVGHFHKDAAHNLVPLCEPCHERVHRGELEIAGYRTTSEGRQLDSGEGRQLDSGEGRQLDSGEGRQLDSGEGPGDVGICMQRLSLAAGPFDRFRFSHKPVAAAGGGGGTFLKNS